MTSEIQFSERMEGVRPSAIRDLLKLGDDPGLISFGGGYPDPSLFPIQELNDSKRQSRSSRLSGPQGCSFPPSPRPRRQGGGRIDLHENPARCDQPRRDRLGLWTRRRRSFLGRTRPRGTHQPRRPLSRQCPRGSFTLAKTARIK